MAGRKLARKEIRRAAMKAMRDDVKQFNERHKLGIGIGKIKRLRVTKSGTISNRRKSRKKEEGS